MKKRILSLILASSMLIVSSTAAFAAQPALDAPANTFYEGNKPFIKAEEILDQLNEDKEAGLFDDSEHDAQFEVIRLVNEAIDSLDADDLSDAITLLTANLSVPQKLYLAAVVRANGGDAAFKADFDAVRPVGGLSLRDSFGELDNYITEVQEFLDGKVTIGDYDEIASKPYIADTLIAILKIMFAQDGTADSYDDSGKYMRENYYDGFLTSDEVKKTLAVLFGADLTEEIVSDSVDSEKGIVRHVKDYISGNNSAVTYLKNALADVMVTDKVDAVEKAFDILGKVVSDAYEGEDVQADVKMLMGDGSTEGLIERLIKSVDNGSLDASNIWLNLFLSEFVQVYNVNRLDDSSITHSVEITDNSSISFKVEGLDDYGIGNGQANLPLRTGWFDIVCYVEGETPGTFEETGYVTYSDGKIQITKDNEKGETYLAYLVLYRNSRDGDVSTFVESYPVTIVNKSVSTSSGGGATRYSVKFETNGGEAINSAYYVKGATVQLTKVPVREGYIFDGWYSDAALTQKVDSIVMDGNVTVYAKWIKDGSAVVSTVDIPEILEGEHHYAYIMGYPDGDIRPMGNITRAETVTMIFRLLKDNVRTANLTEVNNFSDVDEDDWYNAAVSTLAGLGIVEGRTETEFMPDAYITRAEFATLFARLAQFDVVAENKYGDVDNHWAEEHIHEASAYGWIAGYEDDTFRPDKAINRAEAMTLVNRVLKRVPQSKDDLLEGMTIWTDNKDTSAWYYIAIQEATNSHDYERKNESYETWTKLTENRDWTTYEK